MSRVKTALSMSALPAALAASLFLPAPAAAAADEKAPAAQCRDLPASANARAEHAINTKGTGVAGRADGGGRDCDDSDDDCDSAATAVEPVAPAENGQTLRHAINTKGTGTSGRAEAAPEGTAKYSAPVNITATYAAAACPSSSAGDTAAKERVAVKSGRVIPKH